MGLILSLLSRYWKPLVIGGIMVGVYATGYWKGYHHEKLSFNSYKQAEAVKVQVVQSKQDTVTAESEKKDIQVRAEIQTKYRTVIKEVPKYVYMDKGCTIPLGFVSVWNATSDYLSVPNASESLDASPSNIGLSEVLAQHADDTEKFYQCVSQVKGLQEWITSEQKASK